jgi:phage-related holin
MQTLIIRIILFVIYGLLATASVYLMGYHFTILALMLILVVNDALSPPVDLIREHIKLLKKHD